MQDTHAARRLQELGFRFLRCLPNKSPEPGWGPNSTTDDLARIGECYGVVPPLGYLVLDFDLRSGKDGLSAFAAMYDVPPTTWTVRTPSGGAHMYYRYPAERGEVGQHSPAPGVDVRGQHGYVLGPGSPGYLLLDEDDAEIADAPEWLLEALRWSSKPAVPDTFAPLRVMSPDTLDAQVWADLEHALEFIPSDDYDVWVRVGLALAMTAPSERAASTWLAWSARSPKFDERSAHKKWRELSRSARGDVTHRAIFALAMEAGWPNDAGHEVTERGIVMPDAGVVEALAAPAGARDPFPWPELEPLLVGALGDMVEWIEDANPRSLRIAAFGAAVAALGGVLARRLYARIWPGSGPLVALQVPVVVVARTGAGKDAPLRGCRAVTELGGRVCLADLAHHQNTLYSDLLKGDGALGLMLDEADGALASLNARNEVGAGKEAFLKTLLTASAHRMTGPSVSPGNPHRQDIERMFGPGAWAAGVERPAVVLFGASTAGIWDGLAGNVAGGLVGRLLVLDAVADLEPPKPVVASTAVVPASIEYWVRSVAPARMEGSFEIGPPADPLVVDFGPEARAEVERVGLAFTAESNQAARDLCQDRADLFARAIEHVIRVAAILALGAADDPTRAPGPGVRHVRAAEALARWAIGRAAGQTEQRQDASPVARAIRVYRERLERPGGILSAKERAAGLEVTPWHYRARIIRGYEAHAHVGLQAMIASGEVLEDGKRLALASRVP